MVCINLIYIEGPSSPSSAADLETLIFGNRMLYKETSICKQREREYMTKKNQGGAKFGIGSSNSSRDIETKQKAGSSDLTRIEEQIDNNQTNGVGTTSTTRSC